MKYYRHIASVLQVDKLPLIITDEVLDFSSATLFFPRSQPDMQVFNLTNSLRIIEWKNSQSLPEAYFMMNFVRRIISAHFMHSLINCYTMD